MKRTFEFIDDKTSKFWSIEVYGNEFTVNYGKTGTAGQTQTKSFADGVACTKEANKLIAEKTKKGYMEEGTTKLIPFRIGSKFGFCTPAKKMIIPVQYDGCRQFSEGLACVKIGDKCGAINMLGEVVIPAQYENMGNFINGITYICNNGKSGYIDRTGKVIVPCSYDDYYNNFSEGMLPVKKKNKWGFVNLQGKEVIACQYREVNHFINGFAAVSKKDKKNILWGFIDPTGKEIIELKYKQVKDFSDGLAVVEQNDQWNYVDANGKELFSEFFQNAYSFENGAAIAKKGEKYGVINTKGNWLVEPKFTNAHPFSDGLAAVAYDYAWRYIDTEGKIAIPNKYMSAYDFSEGLAFVYHNFKYEIIDANGEKQGEIEDCVTLGNFEDGKTFIKLEDLTWILIDKTGKQISPNHYDDVQDFVEGVAEVTCAKEFEKYAFIDSDGTEYWEKDESVEEKQKSVEKKFKAQKTATPPQSVVLNDDTFPQYTELIDAKTAAKYYEIDKLIQYPVLSFADGDDGKFQEMRLFKGDLHISGIRSTDTREWGLYSLIVDGNLTVDGDIDWYEGQTGSFIIVTGNIKARNVFLGGNPEVVILGNAEISNSIMVCRGDDGGRLTIHGSVNAKYIVGLYYFYLIFKTEPQALAIADAEKLGHEELLDMFLPEYIDEDSVDADAVEEALRQEKNVFRKAK